MIRSTRTTAAPTRRSWSKLLAMVWLIGAPAACGFDEDASDKVDCVRNEDCEGTAICINGTCAFDISCVQQSDCPSGRTCLNGSCVPENDGGLDASRDLSGDEPDVEEDAATDVESDQPTEDSETDSPPDVAEDLALDTPADTPGETDVESDAAGDVAQDLPDEITDTVDEPDAPVDVVSDAPDLFGDFDVQEVDGEIVLLVDTFGDLPESAPEGTRAYVADLDEEFRYSVGLGRWIFLWFYGLSPTVDNRIDGDVVPASEDTPWSEEVSGGGAITVADSTAVLDGSAANLAQANASFHHGHDSLSHWISGTFSVAASTGTGLVRHHIVVTNQQRNLIVNLENGANGIRIVSGADMSLGPDTPMESAATERRLEIFLFAGDRAELYVDLRLAQTVAIGLLPASVNDRYFVGDDSTSGSGRVTVRGALFGTFIP